VSRHTREASSAPWVFDVQRSFGVLQVFLWTFGATLGLITSFQVVESLLPGATTDLVTLGAIEGLVYGLSCFLVWHVYASNRPVLDFLAIRRTHPALPVLGLLLGISLQAPADTLQALVEAIAGPPSEELLRRRAAMMRADSEIEAAMMMISAACVVPLVEELLFRGAFFGGLKSQASAIFAGLMTGLAFVICHLDPRVWLPLAAVAAVLSMLRVVSGSVLPGFALHLAFNAVTLAVVVLRIVAVDRRLDLSWQLSVAGWLATLLLLYAVLRTAQSDEATEARVRDDAG